MNLPNLVLTWDYWEVMFELTFTIGLSGDMCNTILTLGYESLVFLDVEHLQSTKELVIPNIQTLSEHRVEQYGSRMLMEI